MVIAAGSYPAGHWFESDRRYQTTITLQNVDIKPKRISAKAYGPMVKWSKTSPFHGGNPSSNLGRVTTRATACAVAQNMEV